MQFYMNIEYHIPYESYRVYETFFVNYFNFSMKQNFSIVGSVFEFIHSSIYAKM